MASPETWASAPALLLEKQVKIVSGMFGCVGEDYTTLETIRMTGGIAPDRTWEQNLANIQKTALLTGPWLVPGYLPRGISPPR